MRTLPTKFDAYNKAGTNKPALVVKLQSNVNYVEQTYQGDWAACYASSQVDWTPSPPEDGSLILAQTTYQADEVQADVTSAWNFFSPDNYIVHHWQSLRQSSNIPRKLQSVAFHLWYAGHAHMEASAQLFSAGKAAAIGDKAYVAFDTPVDQFFTFDFSGQSLILESGAEYWIKVIGEGSAAYTVKIRGAATEAAYPAGQHDSQNTATQQWSYGIGDLAFVAKFTGQHGYYYEPIGWLITKVMSLSAIPDLDGEWIMDDIVPIGTTLLYLAWGVNTPGYAFPGSWDYIGFVKDGDAITTRRQFYRVQTYHASNVWRDETPIVKALRADFSFYDTYANRTGLGVPASIIDVGNLSMEIDFFKGSTIGQIDIHLAATPQVRKWLAVSRPKNKTVKVLAGFVDTQQKPLSFDDLFSSSLIGRWDLDEAAWTGAAGEVIDASGHGNHGTASGGVSTIAGGKFGRCGDFDGVDDYVSLGNPDAFKITEGALACWVKASAPGSGTRSLLTKGGAYGMRLLSEEFGCYDWSASAWRGTGVFFNDGLWHLAGMSFRSGVADGTEIYVDGALVLLTTITIASQTEPLTLGVPGESPNALLDRPVLFNRPLTAAEHANLHKMGWSGGMLAVQNSDAFTVQDFIDYRWGQIDDYKLEDDVVTLMIKDFSKEWEGDVPGKWQSAADDVTWIGSHHTEVIADVLLNRIAVRDSKLDRGSLATVKDQTSGWQVTHKITGNTENAAELVDELRMDLSAFFIHGPTGAIKLKRWDPDEASVIALDDKSYIDISYDANANELYNRCIAYFNWIGSGDDLLCYSSYIESVNSDSQVQYSQVAPFTLKDRWTTAANCHQLHDLQSMVLARYSDPAPPILNLVLDRKFIAIEAGDQLDLATYTVPASDGIGPVQAKYQIVRTEFDFMGDRIKLKAKRSKNP